MAGSENRASRVASRVSTALARVIGAFTGYALPALISLVFAASVVFYVSAKDRIRLLGTNNLSFSHQLTAVYPVAGALGALLFVLLGAIVYRRVRRRNLSVLALLSRLGDYLLPLGAAPFLLALGQQEIEKKTPFLTLFYAALAGLFVGVGAYRIAKPRSELAGALGDDPEPRPWLERSARVVTPLVLLGLVGAYAFTFSKIAITNHHALVTRAIDLGIYDNIFYQSSHGNFLGCTFIKAEYHGSAHFDPILVLLSPLYRFIYPRAEFILALQSVWIGFGAVPVYLLAHHHLRSRPQALAVAVIYLLHPAVHGKNLYEFHSLSLAPMPMLWALWALASDRRRAYWIALTAALLVREDIPLMMFMVGVTTMWLSPKQRNLGLLTAIVCVIYFVVVKLFFMTSSGIVMQGAESYSFAYYYQELIQGGKGVGSLALSLLTNPAFVVAQITEEAKIQFLVTVFLPLGFLPAFEKGKRLYLLYGLMLTLLASRTAVFSTHFQYTSSILPFAFALMPAALVSVSRGDVARIKGLAQGPLQRAIVLGALVTSFGVSYKFGGIVENKSFRGGFYPVARELSPQQKKLYEWVDQTAQSIPKDKSVGVTNKLGPHVSNRRRVYFYGARGTDYVFVDENELKKDRRDKHNLAIREGRLVEVSRHGSYGLWRAQAKPADKPQEEDGDVSDITDGAGE